MGVSLGPGAHTSVNIIIFSPWNLTVSFSAIISTYNKVGPPVFFPSFYENRCSSLPHQSHAWCHFKMCFRKQLAQSTQLRISFSFFFIFLPCVSVCALAEGCSGGEGGVLVSMPEKVTKNRWNITAFCCLRDCEITPAGLLCSRKPEMGHTEAE